MNARGVIAGYLLGIATIVGCASADLFPWPYYKAEMPDSCYDQGKLIARKGFQNLDLKECKPDAAPSPGPIPTLQPVRIRCITVMYDDFYTIKADNEKCHNDLAACQAGPGPKP